MKNSFLIIALISCSFAFGQSSSYSFKRELKGISEDWHSIELPLDIYEKVSHDLSDIRIFGADLKGNEFEAAYILETKFDEITTEEVDFKVINSSSQAGGYFYTLQLYSDEIINEMSLDFAEDNYDWNIRLEGSQDQKEWFMIQNDYRILSIQNSRMNYGYNRMKFNDSKFKYYRIFVPAKTDPRFISARISHKVVVEGKSNDYKIVSQTVEEDKEKKETTITLKLDKFVPVHKIKIEADDDFDYYRPIRILCPSDSSKSEKGYIVNYYEPSNGIFSSFEENEFEVSNVTTKELKIIISNNDNQPLNISNISVSGYVKQLVARFTEPADYSLTYGNKSAHGAVYDLEHFSESIPEELISLKVGEEISIASSEEAQDNSSFFENPMWLWGIMGFVILLLGFFTFKMLGSEKGKSED
jgi:Protein of unknown function (DUF3999)